MSVLHEEIDKEIFKCIEQTAKGLTRNCARNAIHHLDRTWKIKDIDPEMAVFRAIKKDNMMIVPTFIHFKLPELFPFSLRQAIFIL